MAVTARAFGSRRRRWLAGTLAVVLAAALAAWIAAGRVPAEGETTLEALDVHARVPDFALTERSGRTVTRADLLGHVTILNFIYTHCQETCPAQSLALARLQDEFAGAPDLRLVSVTVDPRHDTPEVLSAYAGRHAADPERWLFLTGDRRRIYCLARGLNLAVVDPADPDPPACEPAATVRALRALLRPAPAFATHGSEGLVMHSARLVLVDRAARVRAYHLATDADSVQRLPANLRALLAEG
jgi:protein SCO1/2